MNRYEEWLERAKSSYEMSLSKETISYLVYYEDLCYQTQQSVEKALKGLLIYYGVEPEFTHNIDRLIKELEQHTEIPENVREVAALTAYAVSTKYPGEYEEITKEEYEKAIKTAKDCLEWVINKIKENEENKKP